MKNLFSEFCIADSIWIQKESVWPGSRADAGPFKGGKVLNCTKKNFFFHAEISADAADLVSKIVVFQRQV